MDYMPAATGEEEADRRDADTQSEGAGAGAGVGAGADTNVGSPMSRSLSQPVAAQPQSTPASFSRGFSQPGQAMPSGRVPGGLGMPPRRRTLAERGAATVRAALLLSVDELDDRKRLIVVGLWGLVIIIFVGAVFYGATMHWSFTDSVYFTVITLTTVGYGDLDPHKPAARLFTCVYVIVGVCWIGGALGVVYSYIVERHEEKMKQRIKLARERLEKAKRARRRVHRRISSAVSDWFPHLKQAHSAAAAQQGGGGGDTDVDSDRATSRDQSISTDDRSARNSSTVDRRSLLSEAGSEFVEDDPDHVTFSPIDMEIMELQNHLWARGALVVICVLVGMFFMKIAEGDEYSWGEALYFACVTITTVGYGDVVPTTAGAKWFTIFYAIVGTILMGQALSDIASYPLALRKKENEKRIVEQYGEQLDPSVLQAMIDNEFLQRKGLKQQAREVSKCEFTLILLHQLGKVADTDIDICCNIFDKLDVDRSGTLTEEDIRLAQSVYMTRHNYASPQLPADYAGNASSVSQALSTSAADRRHPSGSHDGSFSTPRLAAPGDGMGAGEAKDNGVFDAAAHLALAQDGSSTGSGGTVRPTNL